MRITNSSFRNIKIVYAKYFVQFTKNEYNSGGEFM